MKYPKLFDAIKSEGFSEEVALVATMMCLLNCTKKVKNKHMAKSGSFEKELLETFEKAFFEQSYDVVEEAISIWRVMYDWEVGQTLNGLGGCEKKTIRQLLEKRKNAEEETRSAT